MKLELSGQRFGRLLVIKPVKVPGANNAMWLCKCDCGTETIGAASNISKGQKLSCGCLARETAADLLRGNTTNRTHNQTGSIEYATWIRMKRRCYYNKDDRYPQYGGRGITVCDQWLHSFENFLEDMGKRPSSKHSLERKDTNKHYCKENCKWATRKEQMRNTTRNVFIEINNERHCLAEWCEILGIRQGWFYDTANHIDKNGTKRFANTEEALRHLYHKKHSS